MEKQELARSELKKHVGAVHIRNRLTLLQRKMANALLLNAYENLLHEERHSISIRRLSELVGFDSNDVETLKDALRSLTQATIEWNLLDDRGRDIWRVSSMLAEAEIARGECTYAYSGMLREKLYNPEIYARINLAIQRRFSSGYALALYENCARFRSVRATGWWDLGMFRKLMGVEDNEYKQFKDLHKRVIKPAIAQVNSQSDILLSVDFRKQKRRVVAVRFLVEDNPQLMLRLPVKEQLLDELDGKLVGGGSRMNDPDGADSDHAEVRQRLMAFGLTGKSADAWMARKDYGYITDNLNIVETHFRAGRVDNLPAYTVAALRDDFRPAAPPRCANEPEVASEESSDGQTMLLRKDALETLELLHNDFRRSCLKRALLELEPEVRDRFKAEFFANHKLNPLIKKFKKQGLEHPVIMSVFLANYADRLLGDTSEDRYSADFAEFVSERGKNLKKLLKQAGINKSAMTSTT